MQAGLRTVARKPSGSPLVLSSPRFCIPLFADWLAVYYVAQSLFYSLRIGNPVGSASGQGPNQVRVMQYKTCLGIGATSKKKQGGL